MFCFRAALFCLLLPVLAGPAAGADEAAAEPGEESPSGRPPVRIAVVADLSGPRAARGESTRAGAELFARQINRGEKRVELLFHDHRSEPAAAESAAREALSGRGVDGFFVDGSEPAGAISPLLPGDEHLLYYHGDDYSILEAREHTFKVGRNIRQGCRSVGAYWLRQGGERKVVVIEGESKLAQECSRGVEARLPGVERVRFSAEQPSAAAAELEQRGINGVIMVGAARELRLLLQAAADRGISLSLGINEEALEGEALEQLPKKALERVTAFGLPPPPGYFRDALGAAENRPEEVSPAALAYFHLGQMYRALAVCRYAGLICRLQIIGQTPADEVSGFREWNERSAEYAPVLKRWAGGGLEPLGIRDGD